MRLIYLGEARRDAAWWRLYYRKTFPGGRGRAFAALAITERLLQDNPMLGVKVENLELRKLNIPRTPFAFIYRYSHDTIEVVRLYDMRQQGSEEFQED